MVAQTSRIKLEGIADLRAALEELGTEVATKVGVKANRDAATELARLLKEAAPYSGERSTRKYWKVKGGAVRSADYGHLRDNIRVRKIRSANSNTVRHLISTGDAFWGNFLEFGTVKMAARPWARPVLDANYEKIIGVMIDGLRIGVDRAAKRAARKRNGASRPGGRAKTTR